jgi:hypothetical protein
LYKYHAQEERFVFYGTITNSNCFYLVIRIYLKIYFTTVIYTNFRVYYLEKDFICLAHLKLFENKNVFIWHTIHHALFNGKLRCLHLWVRTTLIDGWPLAGYGDMLFFPSLSQTSLSVYLRNTVNFINNIRNKIKLFKTESLF